MLHALHQCDDWRRVNGLGAFLGRLFFTKRGSVVNASRVPKSTLPIPSSLETPSWSPLWKWNQNEAAGNDRRRNRKRAGSDGKEGGGLFGSPTSSCRRLPAAGRESDTSSVAISSIPFLNTYVAIFTPRSQRGKARKGRDRIGVGQVTECTCRLGNGSLPAVRRRERCFATPPQPRYHSIRIPTCT